MTIITAMMAISTIVKFFYTKCLHVGSDVELSITTVMMAITTIAKVFNTKCLQVGSDDDHYYHDGDHDDRQVL